MKIFLAMTRSSMVVSFRRELIYELKARGHDVGVIAFDAERQEEIESFGVSFWCIQQDNRGLNPFSMKKYQDEIKHILTNEGCDLLFTFQMKPNIFAVKAGKQAGVKNIFSMVEGLGDVFVADSLKFKLIRIVASRLYKSAFKHVNKVFFLNSSNQDEFLNRGLVKEAQCELIDGIGVNLERFEKKEIKNEKIFLMVARMIPTKGVFEYCECARRVKTKHPDAVFNYIGAEGPIMIDDIKEYIDDGSICYLGTTPDVRPFLEECSAFVLPSHGEGMPMSVMEAEAVGRAVITTDAAGCRDSVEDGYNGYLVQTKNIDQLTDKCIYMAEHPDAVHFMGENSRTLAEEKFDSRVTNRKICDIIFGEVSAVL